MLSQGAVSSLILLLLINLASSFVPPPFCNGLECPYYNSTGNETIDGRTVEFRFYPSQYWVSTTIVGTNFDDATQEGFERCFDYISGENENYTKIEMTAPVTVYVTAGQGPYCESNFTVSFYVPYNNQVGTNKYPPIPSEDGVFINQLKDMKLAVLSFGGFGNQDVVVAKAAELSELLTIAGIEYDSNHWWYAGYDSPFKITDRHNEIWLKLEN